MLAYESVTHGLVLAGLSASGLPLVQCVGVSIPNVPEGSGSLSLASRTIGTSASFHRIESFGKFFAEAESQSPTSQHPADDDVASGNVEDGAVDGLQLTFGDANKQQQQPELLVVEQQQFSSTAAAADSGTAPHSNTAEAASSSLLTSALLDRLQHALSLLEMSHPDRHAQAVQRLHELELELAAAGAVCPPDVHTSGVMSHALAETGVPNADVQIRVQTSRHTSNTKSVLHTETPGMAQVDPHTVLQLHQQLIAKMNAPNTQTEDAQSGTAPTVTDQKHESTAEGFTSEDGSVVVSKKMTRIVTTTRTAAPGDADANAGDLIRLKVNERVYSGSVDPGDQHIHLVPIVRQQQQQPDQESVIAAAQAANSIYAAQQAAEQL